MTIGIIGVGNIGGVLARDGRVDGIDDGLVESRWHLVDAIGFDPLDAGTIGGRGANSAVRPCTSKTPTSRERRAVREANATCTPQWRATPTSPGSYVSPA